MIKLFNITNFARVTTWLMKCWLLICLGINIAYAENTLQDISFTALPGNKVQLRLTLATTAPTPSTFSTDSPPRLVLDFPDTKLALPSKTITIGIGAVLKVTAIEAEGRCRVVFYFVRKVTYDIKLRANTVLLNMDNGLNIAAQKTRTQIATVETTPQVLPSSEPQIQTPITSPETKVIDPPPATSEPTVQPSTPPTINLESPETETPLPEPVTPETSMQIAAIKSGLQTIDFQRGVNGEGKIVITLDNPNTVINITEKGINTVIIDILNTKLPKSLHQKLNVIDFATPVKTITTEPKDNDIQIKVQAAGEYEYVAYQVDKLYTLEFSPLTPEKIEKNEKQKLMQQQKLRQMQQRKLMQQKKKEPRVYTGEKLTLNFQDIPVRSLLHLLGDFANSNVVISDAVKGNVTLRLKNVPWDQALDIVLKTKFLDQRKHDNVIYVAPLEDLMKQEQAVLDAEQKELEADQKELEAMQKELETTQKIEELAPLIIEIISINYADAKKIQDAITQTSIVIEDKSKKDTTQRNVNANSPEVNKNLSAENSNIFPDNRILLSARGSVTVYPPTNSLIIKDTADQIEKVREIIAKLDVPQKQVLIESRIVIADNNFSKELGVRFGWSGARNLGGGHEINIGGGLAGHTTGTGTVNHGTWLADIDGNPFGAGFQNAEGGASDSENLMVNLPASSANGSVDFLIGKIGSYLLQLELSAMQLEGRGEVVSSPRVVASDNTEALIEQGVEIPYSVVSDQGTNTFFKPIKLALTVIPHITADNRINLELDVRKETPAIFGDDIGMNSRVVKTSILISNGETVSLGGVYEQTKTISKKSIPVFGEIPVLGELFKNTANQDEQRELIIFVTPKILQPEAMKIAK